jgi:hypothetical protein
MLNRSYNDPNIYLAPKKSLASRRLRCGSTVGFYFQQLTPESLRRAIQFLEEAVRLDPNYAIAVTLHGMACLLVPVCRCRVEGKRDTIQRV